MAFKDILSSLGVTTEDQTALTAFTVKYPDLDKLPTLTEYTARTAQIATLEEEKTQAQEELARWEDFREREWNRDASKTRSQIAAEERLAAVTQELTEAKAKQGTEMTFADVEKELTTKGYVKKDDLGTYVDETKMKDRVRQTESAFEAIYSKLTPYAVEYRMRFGKPMENFGEFVNFAANAEALKDPKATFEKFVAEEQRAADFKKQQDDLTAERAKLEADRKELDTRVAGPGVTDTGSVGHFQRTIMDRRAAGNGAAPPEATLGDMSQAQKGYNDWKAGKLKGAVQ